MRAVVLVEGRSDSVAVSTVASRLSLDLDADGVAVVAMGGVTNLRAHLRTWGPDGAGVVLGGLYDAAEEPFVRRALASAGPAAASSAGPLTDVGFFGCSRDLEDELVRAVGVAGVLDVVHAAGETGSFRLLQQQPAQRGRAVEDQLRRFIGSRAGRKVRYARLLAEAVPLDRVPEPLTGVLTRVWGPRS